MKLNLSSDKLVLSVNNPEGGSATEEIAVGYSAAPHEIGFNARYLLDIAGQLKGKTRAFCFRMPAHRPWIKGTEDTTALLLLLMPMRV